MKRLFFALWPDDEVRAKLLDKARLLPINTGHHVPPENFHITLVFLGNVEDQAIPELTDGAEGLSIPSFRLQINHAAGGNGQKSPGWRPRTHPNRYWNWSGTSTTRPG